MESVKTMEVGEVKTMELVDREVSWWIDSELMKAIKAISAKGEQTREAIVMS